MKTSAKKKPNVEQYLAALPPASRKTLEAMRKTIRATVPGVTEQISYGILCFKLNKLLVGIGAASEHCALYVMSRSAMKQHAGALAKYSVGEATVRFGIGKPLPAPLVKKLVKTRLAELEVA